MMNEFVNTRINLGTALTSGPSTIEFSLSL